MRKPFALNYQLRAQGIGGRKRSLGAIGPTRTGSSTEMARLKVFFFVFLVVWKIIVHQTIFIPSSCSITVFVLAKRHVDEKSSCLAG